MSVKVRISYENPQELDNVMKLLGAEVKSRKAAKQQKGKFKRVYVELNDCGKGDKS